MAAAAERVRELGGVPAHQVYGVEIDAATYQSYAASGTAATSAARLRHADFFNVSVGELPSMDAVVGNPPFIRYQRFSGEARTVALQRAREAGVHVSRLTSSWAPFLVHAIQFIKPGGRLAMVAPAELVHAGYAKPVLGYLRQAFRTTHILSFSRKLFPRLSEDTVLVLADGRGEHSANLTLIDVPDLQTLQTYALPATGLPQGIQIDDVAFGQGRERVLHYLLPDSTRDLYRRLRASTSVASLGDLADVGIGYVTGANDFFHVDERTVTTYGLPPEYLRPAVRRGTELSGLRYTHADWTAVHRRGHANLLLLLPAQGDVPASVRSYLRAGIRKGVPDRYKCRVRAPWYRVPHVHQADGFLTYMSGSAPKLVANQAGAVAPNTLHVVRLLPQCSLDALALAALWQTSLTALSAELEGHSLGGGMLKLEPTEARRVLLANPRMDAAVLVELADDVDRLLRSGEREAARDRADAVILQDALGLSQSEIDALRAGWLSLRGRRTQR